METWELYVGAKVALSTNVPFYTIDTIYNGMHFVCHCYPYKTKFVTGKFNLVTEKENPYITFSTGDRVYYEETDELNRTIISMGVKKHNRGAFKDAVKEQLVYVDGIKFVEVDNERDSPQINTTGTKAQVLYNSESIILSEGTVFNQPHIVIVKSPKDAAGINYGFVDFKELEMQQIYGSIGFKCPIRQSYRDEDTGEEIILQDGIAVTPSREKVIWNDATKQYIHTVIDRATQEAENLVEESLVDSGEFFEWIRRCRSTFGKMDNNSVLGRLSNIVDKEKLSPKFPLDRRLKYGPISSMFAGVIVEKVSIEYTGKAKREIVERWDQTSSLEKGHLFIKDEKYSPARDLYICKHLGRNSFLTFQKAYMSEEEKVKLRMKSPETADDLIRKYESRAEIVWKLIEESPDMALYSEVEVPKEIEASIEEIAKKETLDTLSPSELRKLEEKEVGYTLRYENAAYQSPQFILDKVEPKRKDLFAAKDMYYTASADSDLLKEAALFLEGSSPKVRDLYSNWSGEMGYCACYYWTSPSSRYFNSKSVFEIPGFTQPQLIQLSTDLIKQIPEDCGLRPLRELYDRRVDDTVLTMHPDLVDTYTALKLGAEWDKFSYMQYFNNIDIDIYSKYMKLKSFMSKYLRDGYERNIFRHDTGEILNHANRLFEMQTFCMEDRTEEEVAQKSFELFIFGDITDAKAVHVDILNLHRELSEYNEGVGDLLNMLSDSCFTDSSGSIEIQKYLRARDRDNWSWTPKE